MCKNTSFLCKTSQAFGYAPSVGSPGLDAQKVALCHIIVLFPSLVFFLISTALL